MSTVIDHEEHPSFAEVPQVADVAKRVLDVNPEQDRLGREWVQTSWHPLKVSAVSCYEPLEDIEVMSTSISCHGCYVYVLCALRGRKGGFFVMRCELMKEMTIALSSLSFSFLR